MPGTIPQHFSTVSLATCASSFQYPHLVMQSLNSFIMLSVSGLVVFHPSFCLPVK